jgi:hypothetical protein
LIISEDVAMRWFNKGKQKEIWDQDIPHPIGDLEAARKIRDICESAAPSAETVGASVGRPETKATKHETDRYKFASKMAMELAIKISDDLLRDSSVCRIITLCMKANDLRTAAILFRAVQASSMREDTLNEYPALRRAVV